MQTLEAPEGKWLTQTAEVADSSRIMIKKVSGFGDISGLYRIATDEERAAYEQRMTDLDRLMEEASTDDNG